MSAVARGGQKKASFPQGSVFQVVGSLPTWVVISKPWSSTIAASDLDHGALSLAPEPPSLTMMMPNGRHVLLKDSTVGIGQSWALVQTLGCHCVLTL